MAAVIINSDFGAQENKICHCFHFSPSIRHEGNGTGCHDLSFWMLSFKPAFSLSSFTFIKRLFSSSSLSAIRVVSSAYLKLLILLPGISIPAWVNNVLLKLHVSNYFMHIANVWYVTVGQCYGLNVCVPPKLILKSWHTHTPTRYSPQRWWGLNHLWMVLKSW